MKKSKSYNGRIPSLDLHAYRNEEVSVHYATMKFYCDSLEGSIFYGERAVEEKYCDCD